MIQRNVDIAGRMIKAAAFLLVLLGIPEEGRTQSGAFDLQAGGYIKELGQLSLSDNFAESRYDNILHHRLETRWTLTKEIELRADVRSRLLNGYSVRHTPGLEQFHERDPNYFDLARVWIASGGTLLHSHIDRLHLSYINGPLEVHGGRQRVNWGRTLVWNPNDLFNNYAFLDFDYEERPGVDALTAQYSWSFASSIQAGYRIADSWDQSVLAAMIRTNWGRYDVQFTGGHYLDKLTFGTGWAGNVKDAGFKGEISYFREEDQFFQGGGTLAATAAFDYMLNSGVYLQSEFLYNGGFNRRANPLTQLVRPPTADNLFIANTGYFLNSTYQFHPLAGATLGVLGSFDRPLFILIPQLTVSIAENVDLLVRSQLLKGSVFDQALETPNLFFFRLKWSY